MPWTLHSICACLSSLTLVACSENAPEGSNQEQSKHRIATEDSVVAPTAHSATKPAWKNWRNRLHVKQGMSEREIELLMGRPEKVASWEEGTQWSWSDWSGSVEDRVGASIYFDAESSVAKWWVTDLPASDTFSTDVLQWQSLKKGMTVAEVVRLLGEPATYRREFDGTVVLDGGNGRGYVKFGPDALVESWNGP